MDAATSSTPMARACKLGAMEWSLGSSWRNAVAIAAAIGLPVVATLVASGVDLGPFGPPSLYLLAVVLAAAIGGARSGLGAAVVAFLGLNYYFTEPHHTLRVDKGADAVALLVFLVVAVVVGTLLARALAERQRAERQEAELRLINSIATRLLSTELSAQALADLTAAVAERLRLIACAVEVAGDPSLSGGFGKPAGGGPRLVVPISTGDATLGTVDVERAAGAAAFTVADRALLQALAGLIGLAIERRRLDTEARAARTGAELSEIRAALFSSVTHDLRTPLASIKAGITSLMDESVRFDPEERRDLLTTVLEETDRLNRLVDNLLNLARARAGDITIEKELSPFEDVVETVLARLRRTLEPFSVRTLIRGDAPAVWIDPVQMDQALTNIIENAVRYSPQGGEIQVAVTKRGPGIQVRVADAGPGVPEGERDQVFEPFFRGSASTGRPGSGLGLAIARAVVLAHGGKIWLEGAPGGGTAVLIELPVGGPSGRAAADLATTETT
jgi:two-component system, OmpR family, sensor histidine kinase KdpD